ncbi:hypothetical protein J6590_010227 [Homalodisca vitripennis]|nr:hypothetical protein J6590_010227 [Homalodisca vitripennis]
MAKNTVSNREMAKCDQSLSKRQKMCQLLTNSCQSLTAEPTFSDITSNLCCDKLVPMIKNIIWIGND